MRLLPQNKAQCSKNTEKVSFHCFTIQIIFQFQKADVNGDGFLSADEYYRILKDHGIDCTYEEIMQIMQVADKDHDGKIR